jgi:hypothetical protein
MIDETQSIKMYTKHEICDFYLEFVVRISAILGVILVAVLAAAAP